MKSPQHILSRSRLIVLGALVCAFLHPVWAQQDYGTLISQAREQLQNERFVEALASAKDAVRLNPEDFRGHYYLATAYMTLGRFEDAATAAARAKQLAPESSAAAVEKLIQTIATNRQGEGKAAAAEAALADGMMAKAAKLYREAWDAQHTKPELGLKAADLFANRLGEPVTAAQILREVVKEAQGNPAADKAAGELGKLSDQLGKMAQGQVEQARRLGGDEALRLLSSAKVADPDNKEIYLLQARLTARGSDAGVFQAAIKDLARHGLDSAEVMADLPGMQQWLEKADFSEFLTDMVGLEKVGQIKALAAERQAIRKAEEAVVARGGYVNTLGMRFVPVPGVNVLFSVWDTRVQDYEAFVRETRQEWPYSRYNVESTHPVVAVSWEEATAFCAWLTRKERSDGRLKSSQSYRLPTDAEWSVAVGLGHEIGNTPNQKSEKIKGVYPWGTQWPPPRGAGNYGGEEFGFPYPIPGYIDGYECTSPVGSFPANQFGLFDMGGNVKQWCEDWSRDDQGYRAVRGSSCGDHEPSSLLSSYRIGLEPNEQYTNTGFRCVLDMGGRGS
jgi:formylglycine-generating enzyme required for sulfatase activity/tetratricopeptide (TPR) repeat protein